MDKLQELVEGSAKGTKIAAIKGISNPSPTFMRMIVLETICDPAISPYRLNYWKNILGVSNSQYAEALPRNAIIAQKILSGRTDVTRPMFVFPFFSSHLALPCKPGEMVWAAFEDPHVPRKSIAYWFSKVISPHIVDDVNHTHAPAILDSSRVLTKEEKQNKNRDIVYEMRNGRVLVTSEGDRIVQDKSAVLDSRQEDIFESLIQTTDAAQVIQYEAVPRFRKRPGDIALEGTNNTLIVLGTDRNGPYATLDVDREGATNALFPSNTDMQGYAGSIDLVAGRGMTEATRGLIAETTSIASDDIVKYEIEKEKTVTNEGDPDFVNDRSRILISQKTMTDKNFNLSTYHEENLSIFDSPTGDASVVIKTDKIRLIARSDISFVVTDYSDIDAGVEDFDERASEYKQESENLNTWASITIKASGDIIFTPSAKGFIKLGGSDASRAILCTERSAVQDNGIVSALPIATTAGGFVGTDGQKNIDLNAKLYKATPDLGSFSTKVLIK